MRFSGKHPRLLPDVMQAIVDLKEGQGSTQNKILEHIEGAFNTKKVTRKPRNVTMQIRRALKHGVENGLLKQKGGKFVLGIHPRDFALYKSFQQMSDPSSFCTKCKRKRRKRRRGRRRRRRRAIGAFSDSDSSKIGVTPEKDTYMARRRRRRRRRGRRRKVSGISCESIEVVSPKKPPRNSKELIRPRSLRKFETENMSEPFHSEEVDKKPPEENYIN